VNEAVLAKEDPRKRSLLIKHFILITDVSSAGMVFPGKIVDRCPSYSEMPLNQQFLHNGSIGGGPQFSPYPPSQEELGSSQQPAYIYA